jgi:PAS domain S-box-containing protein
VPQRSGSLATRGLLGLASELLEHVDAAVLAVDLQGTVLYANRAAEQLYGRARDEMVGQPSDAMNGVELPPELRTEIDHALRTNGSWEGVFQVRRPDGTLLTVRAVDSPLFDNAGQMIGVVSLATDVTAERTEQFLSECAVALSASLDYEANLLALAHLAVPFLGDLCIIDVAEGSGIRRMAAVHADPAKQPLVDEIRDRYPPKPDGPHPAALAIRSDEAAHIEDADPDTLRALAHDDRHLELINELGVSSFMTAPLSTRDRSFGAITIASCSAEQRFGCSELAILTEVARRAAVALDNAKLFAEQQQARAAAEAMAERLAQLQTLSTALSRAVSVDEVTKVISAIAMATLGAGNRGLWLVDDDAGVLELVSGFDLRGLERSYLSIPLDSELPGAEVVRTREAIIVRNEAERDARFPNWKPPENEGAAFAAVPLVAEERTIGVFALGYEVGHSFDEDELRFLNSVADQCAQALARAQLYDRERLERDRAERDRRRITELNHALQTSLLPPTLPEIPGVELAARYLPALAGLEVGGDFYDAFDTGGDWALVVGDVCGKGPEAAAVTAVARWTIRSVAMDIRQPTQVLRKVNEALVHQKLDDRFCTIAYARVVPSRHGVRLSVCRGGHPAPLVLRGDGQIEPVGTSGTLIGILPDVRLWDETTHLASGDAIVFYTDGVTEARHDRDQFGEERLQDALRRCTGQSAAEIADTVQQAVVEFAEGDPSDDMAILVLRVS